SRLCEHAGALVDPDDGAAEACLERARDEPGARGHIEDTALPAGVHARHEEPPPAWVLAERKERRVALIGGSERGKELLGVHTRESRVPHMQLDEVARLAAAHGDVTGVLAAES